MYSDSFDASLISQVKDAMHLSSDASAIRFLERVQHILRAAHACDLYQKDENAWTEVVRLVLRTAVWDLSVDLEERRSADLEITDIQSQTIDRRYLPPFQLSPGYCDRRTDVAVAFSPQHANHAPIRERLLQRGVLLSHMKDAYTSTVAVAHPVEIKAAHGDAEEAQLQLAVFNASAIKFLSMDSLPMLGWTVLGHKWTLFVTWLTEADEVVEVRAPSLSRNVGTVDTEALLTLLAVLRSGFAWLREEYWPRYVSRQTSNLG